MKLIKALVLTAITALTVSAATMNYPGEYRCTETKSKTYYILTKYQDFIVDNKTGEVFNRQSTTTNNKRITSLEMYQYNTGGGGMLTFVLNCNN